MQCTRPKVQDKRQGKRRNVQNIKLKIRRETQCTRYVKTRDEVRDVTHKTRKGKRQGERCNTQDTR